MHEAIVSINTREFFLTINSLQRYNLSFEEINSAPLDVSLVHNLDLLLGYSRDKI